MNTFIKNIVPALLLTVALTVVGCREFDTPFEKIADDVPEMTEPGLWVASDVNFFDAGSDKLGFEFRALGGDWTLTPKEQYSHLVDYAPKSGKDGNFVIELKVLPNNGMSETTIVFVAKQAGTNVTKEITVKQYTHESKFTRATDSLALLKIAEALHYEDWSPANMWDPKKHITTWAGLTFEEIRGEMRVVGLGINDWEMWGEIAMEIGNLRELKVWNMGGSRLQGSLPSSISYLRNLHTINISFSDNTSIFVPENMDNMLSLRVLKVGSLGITFFENLYKLPALEEFTCSTGLGGELKEGISKWSKLRVLDIANSNVTKLPSDIGALSNLEELNLRSCGGMSELPAALGNLQNLKKLNVAGSGIVTLPDNIGSIPKLEPIMLSNCKKLERLPESFCDLPYSGELSFMGCSALKSLPNGLGRMSGVTKLNLSGCSILTTLPADMGRTITELVLSNCSAMTAVSSSLCGMTQLRVLDISSSGIATLPVDFGSLTSLENLNLNWSKVTALPASFSSLPRLKVLNLSSTELTSLPSNFGDLSTLEELTINSTKIASFPSSFGDLSSLKKLTINYPQVGEIVCDGSVLGKLVNIENISVSKCTFEGVGLSWISKLTRATNIKINESKMGGTIDWSIFPASLTTLDLSKNGISGTLDNISALSSKLTSITINDNLLSGDIPGTISVCTKLSKLSLQNNNITGTIPEGMLKTAMTGYSSLSLNGNRMSGAIPASVLSSTQWSRWKSGVITQQKGYGFSNVN